MGDEAGIGRVTRAEAFLEMARAHGNPVILARWVERLRGPGFVHRGGLPAR